MRSASCSPHPSAGTTPKRQRTGRHGSVLQPQQKCIHNKQTHNVSSSSDGHRRSRRDIQEGTPTLDTTLHPSRRLRLTERRRQRRPLHQTSPSMEIGHLSALPAKHLALSCTTLNHNHTTPHMLGSFSGNQPPFFFHASLLWGI